MNDKGKPILTSWDNEKSFFRSVTENGKIKYFGNYNNGVITFDFVVIQQVSGRYEFRGRVTAVDRRGKKNKDISTDINLHEVSEPILKDVIAEKAGDLFSKHYAKLVLDLGKKVNPSSISLLEAAITVADQFVAIRHDSAALEQRKKYVKRLTRTSSFFPNTPMCELTKKKCRAIIKEFNIENSEVLNELYEFWDYCIGMRICVGTNPIDRPTKNKGIRSKRERNKLKKLTELSMLEQTVLFDMLEKSPSGTNAAVALLASNINTKTIETLTWKDIEFYGADYVVVKLYDPERSGATHNLSRPIHPRSAEVLFRYYEFLCCEYNKEQLNKMPVCATQTNPSVPLKSSRIIDEATRVLMTVINSTDVIAGAKKLEPRIAAVRTVFQNTFKNNLISVCNLKESDLLYKFLTAGSFAKDVSLNHYTALSCKPGWDLAYTILAPLRKAVPIAPNKDYDEGGWNHVFCTPNTSLEFAKASMSIMLNPGERVYIKCPHGVVGSAQVRGIKDDESISK